MFTFGESTRETTPLSRTNTATESNSDEVNEDEKVIGAAVSCGALGLLSGGLTCGALGALFGYACAKENRGPVGEVFREVGDLTWSIGERCKKSKMLDKTSDAIHSVMQYQPSGQNTKSKDSKMLDKASEAIHSVMQYPPQQEIRAKNSNIMYYQLPEQNTNGWK